MNVRAYMIIVHCTCEYADERLAAKGSSVHNLTLKVAFLVKGVRCHENDVGIWFGDLERRAIDC